MQRCFFQNLNLFACSDWTRLCAIQAYLIIIGLSATRPEPPENIWLILPIKTAMLLLVMILFGACPILFALLFVNIRVTSIDTVKMVEINGILSTSSHFVIPVVLFDINVCTYVMLHLLTKTDASLAFRRSAHVCLLASWKVRFCLCSFLRLVRQSAIFCDYDGGNAGSVHDSRPPLLQTIHQHTGAEDQSGGSLSWIGSRNRLVSNSRPIAQFV